MILINCRLHLLEENPGVAQQIFLELMLVMITARQGLNSISKHPHVQSETLLTVEKMAICDFLLLCCNYIPVVE